MAHPTFSPEPGPFTAPRTIPVILGPKLIRAEVPILTGFIPAGALIPDNFVVPHRNPGTGKGYLDARDEALALHGGELSWAYAKCGPSIYTTATVSQLGRFLDAETAEIRRD